MNATARCGAELRSLESDDDFEQCLELQRLTWGTDFRELVPPTILKICQKVGGVVAGAYENGQQLGFVYGLSGIRDGRLAHWSHMLAVHPDHQGRGLGRDLKLFQRRLLSQLGQQGLAVEVMYWTYDPLIARNASLNLCALGAMPVEYVRDMYGAETGSEVHSGLGTDRHIVCWELKAEAGNEPAPLPERPADARQTDYGFCTEEHTWIAIPPDIDQLRTSDLDAALSWRQRTRAALMEQFDSGAVCIGLERPASRARDAEPHYFYVFESS